MSTSEDDAPQFKGPLAWMTRHSVAANLLMGALLIGGFALTSQVKQEVFPEFELALVNVSVIYPGASPEEIEQSILLLVEDAVQGLDGVKEITAHALENAGSVNIELIDGTDPNAALNDVKSAVDRIVNFPEDAERPQVKLIELRKRVISLVISGEIGEDALMTLAEITRDSLVADSRITLAEVKGTRRREIIVEVPQAQLRAHQLSMRGIAQAIRRGSAEIPGGAIKAVGGETLIRTTERRDYGSEFGETVLSADGRGGQLALHDIATVTDGFEDTDYMSIFNGRPAVTIDVYRVGKQTPNKVAQAVKDFIEKTAPTLPTTVHLDTWNDRSRIFKERVDLLLRNARLGLVLVFLALGMFLEIGLAFWVMLGIPISFLGAFILMPSLDVSVNMISLFAFIVTLGIVVDDAIVVGESIYEKRQAGLPFMQAAIEGTREVAVPVCFAVLTTVAAFSPMLFIPGPSGKFFGVIPAIVIAVILISLIESLFILPAHLAHAKPPRTTGPIGFLNRQQAKVSNGLRRFVVRFYAPSARWAVKHRYLSLSIGIAMLLATGGILKGGHLSFTFMPTVEGDDVTVGAELAVGAPVEETRAIHDRLLRTAREALKQFEGGEDSAEGIFAEIGAISSRGGGPFGGRQTTGTHLTGIAIHLVASDQRSFRTNAFARAWRDLNQDVPGVERLTFVSELASAGGKGIDIVLSHPDVETLEAAATQLGRAMSKYAGVVDINNGVAQGKAQLDVELLNGGRSIGLTENDLGRQIRDAFFGAEALRQQRGRDEVRVMVRLPERERETLAGFEGLIVRGPRGDEIPLGEAALVRQGRAFTAIQRDDGRRVLHVTADIDAGQGNAEEILSLAAIEVMPGLLDDYPGLTYTFEGSRKDRKETMDALKLGFPLALFAIFGLLAIPFRSYVQPLIIMTAIPFGIVGAVLGHLALGYNLSMISIFGIVALAGIVVNDSLVLVVAINNLRAKGVPIIEAVVQGGVRRFRPILLTSLTTFFGLIPMIFESSVQARFLIPMAISLGFGVIFATGIILILVPALYVIAEDAREYQPIRSTFRFVFSPLFPGAKSVDPSA